MLVIREQQMQVLRAARQRAFEQSTVEHVRRRFPAACAALGDTATHDQVHTAVQRALDHGMTSPADVRGYVDLTFLLGPDFDRSGRYSWAEELLADHRFTPEVKIGLLTQLAAQRAGAAPPADATAPVPDAADAPPEPLPFDGLELAEEPPAADPNLPEPYDGDLPPDPEEEPLPPLPEYARCDPHFRGLP